MGAYSSLAVDPAGNPHISYHSCANEDLKYASPVGSGGNCGPSGSWQCETLDSTGNVGEYTSLVLDAAGRPHISYWDGTNAALKYAYNDGSSWQLQYADGGKNVSGHTSIALGAGDRPYISYRGGGYLKLAWYDGTAWQQQTVDGGGSVGYSSSLALDAQDQPRISYYTAGYLELKYARSESQGRLHFGQVDQAGPAPASWKVPVNAWQIETVDSAGRVGTYTSLALDGDNHPHITYQDITRTALKYAYHDGLAWQMQTVDGVGDVGSFTALALDAAGRPHISYYDNGKQDLRYAFFDGTAWHTATVDSAGYVGSFTSLALDSVDNPHISYYDSGQGNLRYASFDGAAWYTQTVDSAGDVGQYTALALDAAGRPHIAYYDNGNQHLRYAFADGAAWYTETVDGSGSVGKYAALALDAAGRPHISYYDEDNGDLVYASRDGAAWEQVQDDAWQIQHVDTAFNVGRYTSLAIDRAGFPHIAYQDATNTGLKYAVYDGTAWRIETVDGAGDSGAYAALALDAAGRPHISYADSTWGALLYASGPCVPVSQVSIAGPALLLPGATGAYTASYFPPIATQPVTMTWGDGTVSSTVHYSWTTPGIHTVVVTASNSCSESHAAWQVAVCFPLAGLAVSGPEQLRTGETGLYTATYTPPTMTLPVTVTWDNGAVGRTAAYSWTLPGTFSVVATATNAWGYTTTAHLVEVCRPVDGVQVSGPALLVPGETGHYSATYFPADATGPVTITWDNGALGPAASYSWTVTGTYAVTATVACHCGQMEGTMLVQVSAVLYRAYLPLVLRDP